MKTFFIDKINNIAVNETVTSLNEMKTKALEYSFRYGFDDRKVYIHCSHVCYGTTDEKNVEYIVCCNNRTQTISTKRI